MTTNSSKNDEGLKVEITEDMVFEAAKFGNDYYQNPAKTVKDRTGEKERGYGQIMSDKMYGKIIENGVAAALASFCEDKKFLPDNDVKSNFNYSQPDLPNVLIPSSGEVRPAKKFTEIKYSPDNFVLLNILKSQWDGITTAQNLDDVVIIYASLVDEFCNSLSSLESESGNTLDYLTEDEKKIFEKTMKEIEFLKSLKDEHPNLNNVRSSDTPKSVLILNESELQDWKDFIRESRNDVETAIDELEKELKYLGQTLKARKLDFYGMYRKLYRDKKGFSDDSLDFFLGFKSLRVKIDLVITGHEFKEHSRLFETGDYMYSPNIIIPAKDPFDDNGNLKPDTTTVKREFLLKTDSDEEMIDFPTDIYVEKFGTSLVRENKDNQIHYPHQFGKLTCKGKVRLVKQQTSNDKSEKTTILICCDSDVEVTSDFLGTFSLCKGSCHQIDIENRLGGKTTKGADDFLASKDKIDQMYGAETLQRAKDLAKQL